MEIYSLIISVSYICFQLLLGLVLRQVFLLLSEVFWQSLTVSHDVKWKGQALRAKIIMNRRRLLFSLLSTVSHCERVIQMVLRADASISKFIHVCVARKFFLYGVHCSCLMLETNPHLFCGSDASRTRADVNMSTSAGLHALPLVHLVTISQSRTFQEKYQ